VINDKSQGCVVIQWRVVGSLMDTLLQIYCWASMVTEFFFKSVNNGSESHASCVPGQPWWQDKEVTQAGRSTEEISTQRTLIQKYGW